MAVHEDEERVNPRNVISPLTAKSSSRSRESLLIPEMSTDGIAILIYKKRPSRERKGERDRKHFVPFYLQKTLTLPPT